MSGSENENENGNANMKVYLNGRERRDLACLPSTGDIFEAAEKEASRSGCVLSDIYVDGRETNPMTLRSLAGDHELAFVAKPLQALLRESLGSALEYSQKFKNGLRAIATQIEKGTESEAASAAARLPEVLDGLSWLLGVYDSCRFFMAAPIRADEENFLKAKLIHASGLLVEQAGSHDTAQMARTLRQELMPRVETLTLRIKNLSEIQFNPQ